MVVKPTPSPHQLIQGALDHVMGQDASALNAIAADRIERVLAKYILEMGSQQHFIMATDKGRLAWGHIR